MKVQTASPSPVEFRLWLPIFLAWSISLLSTLGSLFFSEVMKLPPCALCWYQRIGLYPLVFIFTVGILFGDAKLDRYAWPFVVWGILSAGYHNLLYYHVIPESISPCTGGVSCTERQIEWFGLLTIPMLSFFAFLFIALLLGLFRYRMKGVSANEER